MRIDRRTLLKHAGAVVVGAAVGPLVPGVASAHEGEMTGSSDTGGGNGDFRLRRWVMVIDLRACDGCADHAVPPQCTQYCNWSRFVPDGQQWVEVFDSKGVDFPDTATGFMPAPCMHCQNAPCVNVCPVGATFHSPEGTVLVDQERCIGCRLCMAACPYDRRFFNWGDPVQPPQVKDLPYNVETQVPAMRGTVMKCDFCIDRTSAGGLPACVEGCPHGAMYFGDLEEGIATNGAIMVELSQLLSEDGVTRYKEDLGTEPRVYYIPGNGENVTLNRMDGMGGMQGGEQGGIQGGATEPLPAIAPAFLKDKLEWPWQQIIDAANDAGSMPVQAPTSPPPVPTPSQMSGEGM